MDNRVVSVGNWIVVFILMCIPLVNLIMLCVWAFGSGAPESQSNFAKAYLLLMVIGIVLIVLMMLLGVGFLASM
tara:strand:- start:97 stop:318 length:222 start_codon:yes stop_codon:yes gene_type:complete